MRRTTISRGASTGAGQDLTDLAAAGTILLNELPVKLRSLRWVMAFEDVSCHRCATPEGRKFVRLIVLVAGVASCLLITINVSAPSDDRKAAKAATLSGFKPDADTL